MLFLCICGRSNELTNVCTQTRITLSVVWVSRRTQLPTNVTWRQMAWRATAINHSISITPSVRHCSLSVSHVCANCSTSIYDDTHWSNKRQFNSAIIGAHTPNIWLSRRSSTSFLFMILFFGLFTSCEDVFSCSTNALITIDCTIEWYRPWISIIDSWNWLI